MAEPLLLTFEQKLASKASLEKFLEARFWSEKISLLFGNRICVSFSASSVRNRSFAKQRSIKISHLMKLTAKSEDKEALTAF